MILTTLDYQVDTQALTLTKSGKAVDIRPKTCQLLVFLLQNTGSPISKVTLLDEVWRGSVVSDQVVFQSINEIRRLFSGEEVIKTIPQQGYVWLPEVNELQQETEVAKPSLSSHFNISFLAVLLTLTALLSVVLLFNWEVSESDNTVISEQKLTGSILVLPVENAISGNDHSWVRLGLMDQIIQRQPSSDHALVLSADYVLSLLQRADIPTFKQSFSQRDLEQLFRVTGAELIVVTKLMGVPHDYQLSYSFYYRESSVKGVFFDSELPSLTDKLSQLVSNQISRSQPTLSKSTYKTDFNNGLIGEAIERSHQKEYGLAKALLESVVLSEPENLTAQRLLVSTLFRMKEFDQAKPHLDKAIALANQQGDEDELARLMHSKSLYYYVTMDDEKASEVAQEALAVATNNKDWLLMAHVTNIQANVAFNEKNFELAEQLYEKEKNYHKVLGCPVGEANAWSNLARLAKESQQPSKFNAAMSKAIEIAEKRQLTRQLSYFKKINNYKNNQ